jgi:hypothetical protein
MLKYNIHGTRNTFVKKKILEVYVVFQNRYSTYLLLILSEKLLHPSRIPFLTSELGLTSWILFFCLLNLAL